MRALVEKFIAAPPMPQIIVAPRRATSCRSAADGLPVNEYLDGANSAREIAGILVRLGQLGWTGRDIMLRGGRRLMTEPDLQFKQGHRLVKEKL